MSKSGERPVPSPGFPEEEVRGIPRFENRETWGTRSYRGATIVLLGERVGQSPEIAEFAGHGREIMSYLPFHR
jgi:hypothetical protein